MAKTEVLLILGEKNLNNRVYVNNENLQEMIEDYNERAERFGGFGEIGYPESFDISLSHASHSVRNIRVEENTVVGDMVVLDTPYGEKLRTMLDNVVFRPRATGTIAEDGTVNINRIFSFDAVTKETDSFKDIIESKETEPHPIL